MVRVGEDNGTLPEIFVKLVSQRKKQDEVTSKIKQALTYPTVVGIVGFLSVAFIMTNVLPKLVTLIQSMNMTLLFSILQILIWWVIPERLMRQLQPAKR